MMLFPMFLSSSMKAIQGRFASSVFMVVSGAGIEPAPGGLGGEVVFCASDPVDFVKSRIRVDGVGFLPCGKAL